MSRKWKNWWQNEVDEQKGSFRDKVKHNGRSDQLLGRLPKFGSRPNTMGGKFPSVRPQNVSPIWMKFGIQVVLDER